MLSRIANNLYWAGRNLERIEHIARFVPVNFFASLDGPKEADHDMMLQSLNAMAGSKSTSESLIEADVLEDIAFNTSNPSSIKSCIHLARENCRGARDLLSTELWESVNKLYHYVETFDLETYRESNMHEFMVNVKQQVAVCKYQADSTLVKNEVWSILKLGLLIERSFQVSRVISIKYTDMQREVENWDIYVQYECITMLKGLEAFDMNRKYYRKPINIDRALEFLVFNENFPRSLAFSMKEVCMYLNSLPFEKKGESNSVRMAGENLKNELIYGDLADITGNVSTYLESVQKKIAFINKLLNEQYFT
ncbi:alpha-E domain-containing protein [Jiulongibacter sp. NS-SX5]|uniref:alpha-E domain-containing protein n=1 Tax=Jiulongibacter sp. NS-SX5 TaxID=3463854 RepID=UPI0040598AFB